MDRKLSSMMSHHTAAAPSRAAVLVGSTRGQGLQTPGSISVSPNWRHLQSLNCNAVTPSSEGSFPVKDSQHTSLRVSCYNCAGLDFRPGSGCRSCLEEVVDCASPALLPWVKAKRNTSAGGRCCRLQGSNSSLPGWGWLLSMAETLITSPTV